MRGLGPCGSARAKWTGAKGKPGERRRKRIIVERAVREYVGTPAKVEWDGSLGRFRRSFGQFTSGRLRRLPEVVERTQRFE